MQSGSFVVYLVGGDNPYPFKQFAARADAVAHGSTSVQLGEAERARYFEVGTTDARAAIEAVKVGKATYVQSCVRHASESKPRLPTSGSGKRPKRQDCKRLPDLGLTEWLPPPPSIKRRKISKAICRQHRQAAGLVEVLRFLTPLGTVHGIILSKRGQVPFVFGEDYDASET